MHGWPPWLFCFSFSYFENEAIEISQSLLLCYWESICFLEVHVQVLMGPFPIHCTLPKTGWGQRSPRHQTWDSCDWFSWVGDSFTNRSLSPLRWESIQGDYLWRHLPFEWSSWFHDGVSQVMLVIKNPPVNAGDMGSIPGLQKSPGVWNGNPSQYSYLENSMDRGAWQATVYI